jgi:hypothetical protein
VLCSDSPNPRNLSAYTADAKLTYARLGGFGLQWLWQTEACAQWPGNGAEDRYTGPWNRPTANTILLLANTGDNDLPYDQDALAMEHDLAHARLLTVQGYGHTEFSNPSTCALNYELAYLQTGALPSAGTSCQENATPFLVPDGSLQYCPQLGQGLMQVGEPGQVPPGRDRVRAGQAQQERGGAGQPGLGEGAAGQAGACAGRGICLSPEIHRVAAGRVVLTEQSCCELQARGCGRSSGVPAWKQPAGPAVFSAWRLVTFPSPPRSPPGRPARRRSRR